MADGLTPILVRKTRTEALVNRLPALGYWALHIEAQEQYFATKIGIDRQKGVLSLYTYFSTSITITTPKNSNTLVRFIQSKFSFVLKVFFI